MYCGQHLINCSNQIFQNFGLSQLFELSHTLINSDKYLSNLYHTYIALRKFHFQIVCNNSEAQAAVTRDCRTHFKKNSIQSSNLLFLHYLTFQQFILKVIFAIHITHEMLLYTNYAVCVKTFSVYSTVLKKYKTLKSDASFLPCHKQHQPNHKF